MNLLLLFFGICLFATSWLDSNAFVGVLGAIACLAGLYGMFSKE